MRLDINYREKNCKKYKHIEAKKYTTKLPRDHWRNQRGNQKIPRDKWQWKHDNPKPMGCSKSGSKREVYSYTSLPQETRNISNKQTNFAPKAIRERRTKKPQSQQKERNYEDQVRNKWKRNEGNNSKNLK